MESPLQPISFATLLNNRIFMPSTQKTHYAVDKFFLAECLRGYIGNIYFDETWYLANYLDVAAAITKISEIDAHEHYIRFGFFENRLPYPIRIDEIWYRTNYTDVERAVKDKKFPSAQDHFNHLGYAEGRLPYPGFQLRPVNGQ